MADYEYRRTRGVHSNQSQLGSETDLGLGEIDSQSSLSGQMDVVLARIKDYSAGTYVYVVTASGYPDRYATDLASAANPLGARSYSAYQVGTYVLVWFPSAMSGHGLILGAAPPHDGPAISMLGAINTQGTPAGLPSGETSHVLWVKDQIAMAQSGQTNFGKMFNAGRPWDVLGGDWGVQNELGVGIAVGKMLASLKAGCAEVIASAIDDTVRVTANTIINETQTTEELQYCDQGEGSSESYMTPFLWEGLGQSNPNTMAFAEHSSEIDIDKANDHAMYEPEWKQRGIFRAMTLGGYLGDLWHHWVSMPNSNDYLGTPRNWPGLMEAHVAENGFVAIRTAKGLLIEKTNMIPTPQKLREPYDPQGDTDGDCDYGQKPQFEDDQVEYDWGTEEAMARPCIAPDNRAWLKGVSGVQHIRDKEKDWRIPNDSECYVGGSSGVMPISPLSDKFSADLPDSDVVDVDYRRKGVKYYKSTSSVHMLDDGGIVLSDGYGSSISMSGGNITITCPGDVIMRPGRRFVALAPHDLVARSGRNTDISSSNGNVRIKAEKNLHMLSGNSGTGGTLIENRAKSDHFDFSGQGDESVSSGVVIKSQSASTAVWAKNAYIRSMSGGKVSIDADAGKGEVLLVGSDINAISSLGFTSIVGAELGGMTSPENVSVFKHSGTEVVSDIDGTRMVVSPGAVSVVGSGNAPSSLLIDGSVTVSGVIAARNEKNAQPGDIRERVSNIQENAQSRKDAIIRNKIPDWQQAIYADANTSIGNDRFIDSIQFSFNNSQTYQTEDVRLYETLWQHSFKSNGGQPWVENTVTFAGAHTMPWPGYEVWTGSESYGRINAGNNVDLVTMQGKAWPRGDTKAPDIELTSLQNGYLVDPLK